MGTLMTSLNEDSALYSQLTQQAVPPVHSVTLLESKIVDNNLDEEFDKTWAPTTYLSHNDRLVSPFMDNCISTSQRK